MTFFLALISPTYVSLVQPNVPFFTSWKYFPSNDGSSSVGHVRGGRGWQRVD